MVQATHRKPFKSCGLIGPKKLQWTSLLGKITLPVPTKTSIALEKKHHYVPSQCKVDLIANEFGYDVLSVHLYHCVLNTVEMVSNQLKTHACQLSVFMKEPGKFA